MDLTNFGLKNTKSREQILDILKNSHDPISADDIFRLMDKGQTNLSTVYRTLLAFCQRGILSREIRPDGTAVYSYNRPEHHHVLICIKCNKKIHLDRCPYKNVNEDILNETGFKVEDYNIELYGYCKECQEK